MRTFRLGASTRVGLVAVVLACGACGGDKPELAQNDPLAACEAYVAAYRACNARTGAPASVIEERAASLRRSFEQTGRDHAARAVLRARCSDGVARIEESCR